MRLRTLRIFRILLIQIFVFLHRNWNMCVLHSMRFWISGIFFMCVTDLIYQTEYVCGERIRRICKRTQLLAGVIWSIIIELINNYLRWNSIFPHFQRFQIHQSYIVKVSFENKCQQNYILYVTLVWFIRNVARNFVRKIHKFFQL